MTRRPDLVLRNAVVRTLDDRDAVAGALAVAGNRIVWVGPDDEAPAGREELDCGGRCVLPGFTDSHAHLVAYSVGLERLDLRACTSLDEALALVAERAAATPEDGWILGRGWIFRGWGLQGFPDRGVLDRVCRGRPAALSSLDGHVLWVNSEGLRLGGIGRDTPDPEGGEIERDPAGEPTGILKERAADLFKETIPVDPPDVLAGQVLRGQAALHALGITSVHDMERRKALRAFTRLDARGALQLRLRYFVAEEELGAAEELGLEAGFGGDRLRIAGVKAYADGALLSETAFMLEPYGKEGKRGIPVTNPAAFEAVVRRAAELRLPVVVHAIGDAANRLVLDAFEKAAGKTPTPCRVEHAQHLRPEDATRFARLGVAASMQPIHLSFDLDQVERALGPDRAPDAYRFRDLLDAGARLVFGSDAPIADPNPWLGVHAAVNRVRADDTPAGGWHPEQAVTLAEAVRAYTRTPAEVSGDGADRGTLEPGKRADLCVVEPDPFTLPPLALKTVRVALTVFDGAIVHRAGI